MACSAFVAVRRPFSQPSPALESPSSMRGIAKTGGTRICGNWSTMSYMPLAHMPPVQVERQKSLPSVHKSRTAKVCVALPGGWRQTADQNGHGEVEKCNAQYTRAKTATTHPIYLLLYIPHTLFFTTPSIYSSGLRHSADPQRGNTFGWGMVGGRQTRNGLRRRTTNIVSYKKHHLI